MRKSFRTSLRKIISFSAAVCFLAGMSAFFTSVSAQEVPPSSLNQSQINSVNVKKSQNPKSDETSIKKSQSLQDKSYSVSTETPSHLQDKSSKNVSPVNLKTPNNKTTAKFTVSPKDKSLPISIITEVDKSTITLGDIFRYSIIIKYDSRLKLLLPGWGVNVGQFEIRDYKTSEKKTGEEMMTARSDYFLSIYDTGTFTIPPIAVAYSRTGKNEKEKNLIFSDTVTIKVKSIASAEAKDIKKLKEQVSVPPNYTTLYLIIGSIVLLIVLILGIIYLVRRHRKKGAEEKPIYLGPPHEIAYRELDALLVSDYLDKGLFKKFYFELSEIIRRYLGRRFQIFTIERTSAEIEVQIEELYLSEEIVNLMKKFLSNTDFVKFSEYKPSKNEIERDVLQGRKIIDETKVKAFTQNIPSIIEENKNSLKNQNTKEAAPQNNSGDNEVISDVTTSAKEAKNITEVQDGGEQK